MSGIWSRIGQLEGETLSTVTEKRTFTILKVDNSRVYFLVHSTDREYTIRRETFTRLIGVNPHKLTLSELTEQIPSSDKLNNSYIQAILYRVAG